MGVFSLLIVSFLVARSIARPLRIMAAATKKIADGDLSIDLSEIKSHDEVGQLSKAFEKMTLDLQNYIKDLTETTAAKQKIESELSIAAQIQRDMLPSHFPAFPDQSAFDIFAIMRPAKTVGGDFYDFFMLDEQKLAIVIGDVSGKGIPAALHMAVTKYLIKAFMAQSDSPDEILKLVNKQLILNNESCMFVTIFVGILNVATGEMNYASGGHNPLLVLDSDNPRNSTFLNRPGGPVVGIIDDADFQTEKITLQSGWSIVAYTDGVTEAFNTAGEAFLEERLKSTALGLTGMTAKQIAQNILNAVDEFCKGAPQADDITLLAVQSAPHSSDSCFPTIFAEVNIEGECTHFMFPASIVASLEIDPQTPRQ